MERLAHLGAFGEIKITKLEPERTVAWEGDSASGTVSIEPSGLGNQGRADGDDRGRGACSEPEPEPEPELEPEPVVAVEPPAPKRRWLARVFGWDRASPSTQSRSG